MDQEQALPEYLQTAINVWCDPSSPLRKKILKSWHRPECPLLDHARKTRCDFVQIQHKEFQKLKAALTVQHAENYVRHIVSQDSLQTAADIEWRAKQCLHLLNGLVSVIEGAAMLWKNEWEPKHRLPDDFELSIKTAIEAYEDAWALESPGTAAPKGSRDDAPSRSQVALMRAVKMLKRDDVPVISYLTVQHLLAYLLGETDTAPAYAERTNIVLVDRKNLSGHILPLQLTRKTAHFQHFYLDPVAVGLTLLDDDLVQSLNLAWQAATDDRTAWSLRPDQAICLAPQTHSVEGIAGIPEIDGESAGGVFACAVRAAALGDRLDSEAAASVALELGINPEGYDELRLKGVDEKTFHLKLGAVDLSGIERFAYYEQQKGIPDPDKPLITATPFRVTCLGPLYKVLMGNAAVERVLKRYAEKQQKAWEEERRSVKADALLYYVPPNFGWMESQSEGATKYHRIEGESEEDRLEALLQIGRWLRIAENPGVGKSVFTRRLQAFLSSDSGQRRVFGGKPPLVVRWENIPDKWPRTNFVEALEQAVKSECGSECDATEVVSYAIKHKRCAIILDAMDQVGESETIEEVLSELNTFLNEFGQSCYVVLTGRPLIINAHVDSLWKNEDWTLAHIEDFDLHQQYRYLRGPSETELRSLFGSIDQQVQITRLVKEAASTDEKSLTNALKAKMPYFDQVNELLRTPYNLYLIRELARQNRGTIPEFTSRADIYLQTCLRSIRRALQKILKKKSQLPAVTLRIMDLLSAIACEMMVRNPAEIECAEDSFLIQEIRDSVGQRLSTGAISDDDWDRLRQVTGLSQRVTLRDCEDWILAWHHPRMMQFFCGLYLARNSQPDWDQNEKQQLGFVKIHCGDDSVRTQAANPLWEEAFRFAMEIPAGTRNDSVLPASISLLFEPPPPDFVRPSQLIWEAWQLFEPEDGSSPILQGAEVIRRQFQQPYENMLTGKGTPEQQQIADVFEQGFVLCPPSKENLSPYGFYHFTMDTPGATDREVPVEVELSPFQMQQFPVTREQYALYDPHHDQAHQKYVDKYAKEPGCPVIDVTWWDAWSFALFTGKILPSEAQWECACRAETETAFAFGDELTHEQANFGVKVGHTTPQGNYSPNKWELYDMHGNVWEWCQDWYHDKLPGGRNPLMLGRAASRVIRGGSWNGSAEDCRSACRFRCWPEFRLNRLGFRVAAVPAEPSQDRKAEPDT